MKNSIFFLLMLLLGFSWTPAVAQQPVSAEIYNNHVRSLMHNNGQLFWDRNNNKSGFAYPGAVIPSSHSKHTIFAQGLWLSGVLPGGDVAVAATTYGLHGSDYQPGPIDDSDNWHAWTRVWYVEGTDIHALIADWDDNGVINSTPAHSLLEWPGRGNPWFEQLTGLQLPDREMAPFFDRDGDGIYDPWKGDYPIIRTDCETLIPGSIGWTLFNDIAVNTLSHSPRSLQVEVRTTMFSFPFTGIGPVDHSIFVKYEVTSFNPELITDFSVGHWVDTELGCFVGDRMGSDPGQNTFYAYNIPEWEHSKCNLASPKYGDFPPVQTVSFLDKPLSSFIQIDYSNFDIGSYLSVFRNMRGLWSDGTPLTVGGNGYQSSTDTTTFHYHDRPSQDGGWSGYTTGPDSLYLSMLGSTATEQLATGQTYTMYSAYSVHREYGLPFADMVDMALDNIPAIQAFFDNCFTWPGVMPKPCVNACVWPGDLDGNGIVNNLDFLYYGVRKGQTGIPRDFPFTGWKAQDAEPWDIQDELPGNASHTDADGNGLIDALDVQVAMHHLYRTREGYTAWGGSNDPGDDLTVVRLFNHPWATQDTILSPGDRLMVRFTFKNPVDDPIYGLGYSIRYDTTILEPIPLNGDQDFFTNGLGTGIFQRAWQRPDGVDVFATRSDGVAQEVDSWHMLQMQFFVKSPLPPTGNPITTIRYQNYLLLREDGSSIPIGAHGLDVQYGPITSTELVEAPGTLRIWPNPGRDLLYLASPVPLYRVEVYDQVGRRVLDQAFSGEESLQIPTHQLAVGMYMVEAVDAAGNRFREKWVKLD